MAISSTARADARFAWQPWRLLSSKETRVGAFDRACIDQEFTTRPSPAHNPQPWVGRELVPRRIEHPLHELHASLDLDEKLFRKHEWANAVHDDRLETRWLLQHATSVEEPVLPCAPAGAQPFGLDSFSMPCLFIRRQPRYFSRPSTDATTPTCDSSLAAGFSRKALLPSP